MAPRIEDGRASDMPLIAAQARIADPDAYFAALFAPPAARSALLALATFAAETAHIADKVSEPSLGEIRLQWWRDRLRVAQTNDEDETASPLAAALGRAMRHYDLPFAAFDALLSARVFDLYNDPMPSLVDLEGYAGETRGAILQMGCLILQAEAGEALRDGAGAAAGRAAAAMTLTGILQALPRDATRRRLFLPADVLARHGVDPQTVFAGHMTQELTAAVGELTNHALHHLDRLATMPVGATVVPALLPVVRARLAVARLKRGRIDLFRQDLDAPLWRRHWAMWRAAQRGGFSQGA